MASAPAPRSLRSANNGNASQNAPTVKFQEILAALIAESPYNTNRRPIWEHAGVTSAALSQYVVGKAKPRIETLALLADFFGVTLDYLVLGREAPQQVEDESRSMARYVDWALADMQVRTSTQTWLVTRIGQALAGKIDEVAKDVLPSISQVGGVVTENEALLIEKYSLHSKLVSTNLEYDVIDIGETRVPGRFARAVAQNLLKSPNAIYQFLVPPQPGRPLTDVVHYYRKLLGELGVGAERMKQCKFLMPKSPVLSGYAFHQLDIAKFSREEPLMHEALKPNISATNWVGFTLHQNTAAVGGLLYDAPSLQFASNAFDELWANGTSIV